MAATPASTATLLPANLSSGLEMRQLPALDGMRAIAAFLVVFYHISNPAIPGGLGVLAFFVISGFLITWLLLKEHQRYGTVSLRAFYARRSLRIFPAFYCYWLLIMGIVVLSHKPIVKGQAIASFFFVNNYYQALNGDPNTGLSHTWSLGIEEQFYLLWPALFLVLRRFRPAVTAAILAVVIVVAWIYRLVLDLVFHVDQGYIYEAFDTRADQLMIGCLLAIVLFYGIARGLWRSLCSSELATLIAPALLIGSVLLENIYGTGYRDSIGFILNPLLVVVLLVQWIAFRESAVWGWLNWPWVRYLGRISYSVYLYQQIAPAFLSKVIGHRGPVIETLTVVPLVIVLSSASHYIIERPFLILKDRFRTVAPIRL